MALALSMPVECPGELNDFVQALYPLIKMSEPAMPVIPLIRLIYKLAEVSRNMMQPRLSAYMIAVSLFFRL